MKKILSFVFILSVLALIFTGCNTEESKSQETVKNFLTAYYTVDQSDYDYYEKMMKGANPSDASEVKDFSMTYEEKNKEFQQYLSDESYNEFFATRMSYLRIKDAYKNNVFIEIKDLKISKSSEDKTAKTITYNVEMELNQVDKNTKEQKIVKKTSELTVVNENGNWKIVNKFTP